LLLRLVADVFGVPYSQVPTRSRMAGKAPKLSTSAELFIRRPHRNDHAIAVTLFVMTYVVRRAQRLREEWHGLDIVRQQYILNIRDLIVALNLRKQTTDAIQICLFAVLHICLSYSKVLRYGEDEALRHYFVLLSELAVSGKREAANLCAAILAVIVQRTAQIPASLRADLEETILPELRSAYHEALANVSRDQNWLPGTADVDPWRYRIPMYDLQADVHRIIMT
jgi:hypothetical protein